MAKWGEGFHVAGISHLHSPQLCVGKCSGSTISYRTWTECPLSSRTVHRERASPVFHNRSLYTKGRPHAPSPLDTGMTRQYSEPSRKRPGMQFLQHAIVCVCRNSFVCFSLWAWWSCCVVPGGAKYRSGPQYLVTPPIKGVLPSVVHCLKLPRGEAGWVRTKVLVRGATTRASRDGMNMFGSVIASIVCSVSQMRSVHNHKQGRCVYRLRWDRLRGNEFASWEWGNYSPGWCSHSRIIALKVRVWPNH